MSPYELKKIEHFKEIHLEIKNIVPNNFSGNQLKQTFAIFNLKQDEICKLFDISVRTLRNWHKKEHLSILTILAVRSILSDKILNKQTQSQFQNHIETITQS